MDDETIRGLAGDSFPKLLQCPFSGRVGPHVALQDKSSSEFEDDKRAEQLKPSRECNH
jgi:hypothetical protein